MLQCKLGAHKPFCWSNMGFYEIIHNSNTISICVSKQEMFFFI